MNQNQEFNVDEAQIGRILHYVIDDNGRLQCRPAIVVYDWPDQGKPGYVNLNVFMDGMNDRGFSPATGMIAWETSVMPNHAVKAYGTWHWPRECGNLQPPAEPYYDKSNHVYHHKHAVGVVDTRNCYACSLVEQK